MESDQIKKIFEVLLILAVLLIGLYFGLAPFQNKLNHEYPVGYFASDPFWHQGASDCLSTQESGTVYYCDYMVMGNKDVLSFNPPLLYHLSVMFSSLSGMKIYDSVIFLTLLFLILSLFLFYLVLRHFSLNVALLALPFMLLVFSSPFYHSYVMGQWLFVIGSFYLIGLFFILGKPHLGYAWIPAGIFLTAMALTHASELIFGVMFLFIYLIWHKLKWNNLKKVLLSFALAVPLSAYYLLLFYVSYIKNDNSKLFTIAKEASGFPTVNFSHLSNFSSILPWAMGFGILVGIYLLFKEWKEECGSENAAEKSNGKWIALASGLFMLLIGFSNYVGLNNRAFQTRFFWPLYLSLFAGLALFFVIDMFKKYLAYYKEYLVIGLSILLLAAFGYALSTSSAVGVSLMDKPHWEGITYFHNVPAESKVLFVYGDIYSQDQMLWNTRRLTNRINIQKYVETVQQAVQQVQQNNTQQINLQTKYLMDPITTYQPYWERKFSLSSFKEHNWTRQIRSICEYDYLVFDLQGRTPPLIQYELLIRQKMLDNKNIEKNVEVLNNGAVSIVRNNNVNGECV